MANYSESLNNLVSEILAEMVRQDIKWGANRTHSPSFWLTILVEEVGEIATAILKRDYANMYEETIHTIAVAFQIVKWLKKEKIK